MQSDRKRVLSALPNEESLNVVLCISGLTRSNQTLLAFKGLICVRGYVCYSTDQNMQNINVVSVYSLLITLPHCSFMYAYKIQWRPLIIIADNVINRLLLSKSVVPKHSI